MEFIPENLFDSELGENFLVELYKPKMQSYTDSIGLDENQAREYVKAMTCGGSINVSGVIVQVEGGVKDMFKENIGKLNDKLSNLKDGLTSTITSITSYVSAIAIPTSMAAGIAGILSTIGNLKQLNSTISEIKDLMKQTNLDDPSTLNRLVPGAGSLINGVLGTVETTINTLTALVP